MHRMLALLLAFSLTPVALAEEVSDIVDTAATAGQFKTLLAAAEAAGLVDALRGDGPLTVFAPTDAAFAKLPEGALAELLEDKAKLKSILLYHVVPGAVMAADVVKLQSAASLGGQHLRVTTDDKGVKIDDARVIKADIKASNGVIHVIDSVVMPRADIVDTAAKAGTFKTLLAAAKAAGLVDALKGKGPLTVFAPSDEAFAKLPAGTVEALLKDPAKLKQILLYHVVAGYAPASVVASAPTHKTLQGATIAVKASDAGVHINKAKVVAADVLAGNGVIHVIDQVILPPQGK